MVVETKGFPLSGTVLVDPDGGVWYAFSRPWWDLASWVWWLMMPGEKAWVRLKTADGGLARLKAVRLATEHVVVGSVPGRRKVP